MSAFKRLFILLICCVIFIRIYGIELGNSVPYRSSPSLDESKFEKKVFHVYPKSSLYDEHSETTDLLPNVFKQKLLFKVNEDSTSNLSSYKSKKLQMQQRQHLVRVESKKISESLESAPIGGGYDISINPKYSHIIEIIHRRDNPEKQKLSNVRDSSADKQGLELTKNADLNKTSVTEATENPISNIDFDNNEFGDGDPEEFSGDEEDPEEFGDVDEGDPEEFGDVNEGYPQEFGDVDERDSQEFGDVDEGDPKDFGDDDEGDTEDFGDADEGDPEDFGDADEGDPEEFGDADEGDPEEIGDADEGDPEEIGDADEGDPKEFGDANEGDPEETSYNVVRDPENKDYEDLPLDETENKLIDEANITKQTVTANDNISSNKESAFNEEFEGSGEELSIISDQNNTKSGRILGMFSRQNETFPNCTTPKGEAGHCRRLGECLLSEALNNFNGFLQQLCLIRGALVGICCPNNPVIEIVNPEENVTSCGLNTKTRIVGGSISVPHEWTWMVALMRRNRFYCGGVIINNWYILTAAHCVMGINVKDLTVRLGEYDFNEQSKHTEDLSVAEIKRHAQFVTLTFQHDIALLKLKRSIKYSKFVGSICLPEQKGRDYTDVKGTVVGWGTVSFGGAASPILRQVTIPVWKNEDCDRTYLLERIGESFLCAGSPEKGEDACQGDSGGPLMTLNENGRWEVIGLVSWGRRCGDPTYPGVYTRVTTYLDWIKQNAV